MQNVSYDSITPKRWLIQNTSLILHNNFYFSNATRNDLVKSVLVISYSQPHIPCNLADPVKNIQSLSRLRIKQFRI